MLEAAEVGHVISKAVYARQEPRLREALLNAQYDLSQSKKGPVLLVISGVEGGGRSETANKLTEWMDPRHIRVVAFGGRTAEESTRPAAWRYWNALPLSGLTSMNAWRAPGDSESRIMTPAFAQPEVGSCVATRAVICPSPTRGM